MNLEDKENLEKLLKSIDFKNIQIGLQLVNSLNIWEEIERGFNMLAFFQKLTYANRFAEIITNTRNTNTILTDELIPNIFDIEKLYKERNTAKIEEEVKKIFEEAPHIFQFIDWFKLDETKKYVIIQESYWGENELEEAKEEEDFKSYAYDDNGNNYIIFQGNDFLDLITKFDKHILKGGSPIKGIKGYSKDAIIENIVSDLITIKDNFSNEIKLSKEELVKVLQNFHASLFSIFDNIEKADFIDSEEMIFIISSVMSLKPKEFGWTAQFFKVDKDKSFTK